MQHSTAAASQHRWLRDAYRRNLGIEPHQRLVAVASAAGRSSLWAHHPTLVEALLAELPMDAFRVAFLPDPDILSPYGSMTSMMFRPLVNGLLMPKRGDDWQAVARAVVRAADGLIGDHGDTSLVAAALGTPVALAAFDHDIPSGSPRRALLDHAVAFSGHRDRRAQVEALCAAGIGPVDDSEPAEAPVELDLVERYLPTSSWRCEIALDTDRASWSRFPDYRSARHRPGHLVADALCLDTDARDAADIIVRHHAPLPEADAHARAQALLREHPLASVAAVRIGDEEMVMAAADHRTARARCRPEHCAVAASVWHEAGRPAEGQWHLTGPTSEGPLRVTALPDPTL